MKLEIAQCISVNQERGKMSIDILETGGMLHTLTLSPELFRQIVWDAMGKGLVTPAQLGMETSKAGKAGTIVR